MTREQYRQILQQRQQSSGSSGFQQPQQSQQPKKTGWSVIQNPTGQKNKFSLFEGPGIIRGMARAIASPFVKAGVTAAAPIVSGYELATGQKEKAAQTIEQGFNVPGFGQVTPVGTKLYEKGGFEKGVKEMVGTGAGIASTLAGGGEAQELAGAAKGGASLMKLGLSGAKEGSAIGAMVGAGSALQENKSLLEAGASGLKGAFGGAALGFASPFAIKGLQNIIEKAPERVMSWWDAYKNIPSIEKAGTPEETALLAKESPNVLQHAPDKTSIPKTLKDQAEKAGIHSKFIDLVEGASKKDRTAMKEMVNAAEESSKNYLSPEPKEVVGKTILDRVDHLQNIEKKSGQILGQTVKTMPKKPFSVQTVLDNFTKKLNDMGVQVTKDGLDFSQSSLSGTSAGPTQSMLEKTYKDLIGEGGVEMLPQRMHTLRQSLFGDLHLGKAGATLDSRGEVVLNGVREDLMNVLSGISKAYARNSKKYAITEKALQTVDQFMGKKFASASEDVLQRRAGELASRFGGNASADALRVLGILEDAAKQTGYKTEDNVLRQAFFSSGLNEIFDITKPTSFEGGMTQANKKALEAVGVGLKAFRSDVLGVGESILQKAIGRTPEKAQKVLKQILEM